MFNQYIQGIITLSFYLIITYNINPNFLITIPGQLVCSISIGMYLYFLSYKQLQNMQNSLLYSPSEGHKDAFDNLIQQCNVDPKSVIVKYAYIAEGIAMAAGKTIIIDPLLWHGIDDDPQAISVKDIFTLHLEKNLTANQKTQMAEFHQLLTPESQRFIFKHELGHIVQNFATKKLLLIFFLSFLATYIGITATIFALQIHGFVAIFAGILVSGCIDLFLTYGSNVVWKLQEEKAADRFAVQYSSTEDVQAAALFFENHQHVIDRYKQPGNFMTSLPSVILSGHQHGTARSSYLLKLLANK